MSYPFVTKASNWNKTVPHRKTPLSRDVSTHPASCQCTQVFVPNAVPSIEKMREYLELGLLPSYHRQKEVTELSIIGLRVESKRHKIPVFEAKVKAIGEAQEFVQELLHILELYFDTEDSRKEAYQEFYDYLHFKMSVFGEAVSAHPAESVEAVSAQLNMKTCKWFINRFTTMHALPIAA